MLIFLPPIRHRLPPINIRLREASGYVKPTTPRSIGGILDDAIKLYRDAFTKSWPLALIGQVLLAVPMLIIRTRVPAVPAVAGNPFSALAIYKSPGVWLPYLIALIMLVGINNALV